MQNIASPDPLEPGLLPADPYWLEVSHDVSSAPGVRPFGLTRTTVVPEEQIVVVAGLRYDPARQITVDAEGVPAICSPGRREPTYSTQWTVQDMQRWPDNNADD
jgi:putative ATP-grasp target RiPP